MSDFSSLLDPSFHCAFGRYIFKLHFSTFRDLLLTNNSGELVL